MPDRPARRRGTGPAAVRAGSARLRTCAGPTVAAGLATGARPARQRPSRKPPHDTLNRYTGQAWHTADARRAARGPSTRPGGFGARRRHAPSRPYGRPLAPARTARRRDHPGTRRPRRRRLTRPAATPMRGSPRGPVTQPRGSPPARGPPKRPAHRRSRLRPRTAAPRAGCRAAAREAAACCAGSGSEGAAVAITSSTSATVTSARSSPASRARSTSCPTTSAAPRQHPSRPRPRPRAGRAARPDDPQIGPLPDRPAAAAAPAPRSVVRGAVLARRPTRSTCGGSSRPAPEATDVRRKRDSADHGSSSWPSAARACSVSRAVSSSAIRRTSTSLLGNRRYTVPTPTRARRATSSIGAPYPSSPKTSRAARSTCSRLRWASTRSGVGPSARRAAGASAGTLLMRFRSARAARRSPSTGHGECGHESPECAYVFPR